jgi:hypothetical protein
MKTTVEIADELLGAARTAAAQERTTLRALIEEGLRAVLQRRRQRRKAFRLRDASFHGDGVQRAGPTMRTTLPCTMPVTIAEGC